jgi:hypothetical protein
VEGENLKAVRSIIAAIIKKGIGKGLKNIA